MNEEAEPWEAQRTMTDDRLLAYLRTCAGQSTGYNIAIPVHVTLEAIAAVIGRQALQEALRALTDAATMYRDAESKWNLEGAAGEDEDDPLYVALSEAGFAFDDALAAALASLPEVADKGNP